jgi:hypothetical protein
MQRERAPHRDLARHDSDRLARQLSEGIALTPLYRRRAGGLRPPARHHANPSSDRIEEGDHGNTALYLGGYPSGNAQVDILGGGGVVAILLLEMMLAAGLGFVLGFVLKATFSVATISWSQDRVLREAARARENAGWEPEPYDQPDPYDRLTL